MKTMVTVIIILVVVAVGMFLLMNMISSKHLAEVRALEEQKLSLMKKYDFMVDQRKALRKELEDKERELATLKNEQEGIKTFSARELNIDEESEDHKIGRYLIQEGKITLEQNEKVLKKIDILKMDYVATSLALGYIDLKTAKKALKINKISSRTLNIK